VKVVFSNSNSWHYDKQCIQHSLLRVTGARTDIENNESKTAFDLAKDAETAALLQHAGESYVLVLHGALAVV